MHAVVYLGTVVWRVARRPADRKVHGPILCPALPGNTVFYHLLEVAKPPR